MTDLDIFDAFYACMHIRTHMRICNYQAFCPKSSILAFGREKARSSVPTGLFRYYRRVTFYLFASFEYIS